MKHMLSVFFLFLGFALFAAEPGRVEGKAVFKLKSEYRHLLQKSWNRTGIESLDAKLEQMRTSSLKPFFNTSPVKSADHDISLIYTVETELSPEVAVNLLSRDIHVQYAEVVYPDELLAVPDDPNYAASAYFAALEAEAAWEIHKGEEGVNPVVLALIDTGCRWSHPDLAQNIWNNLGEDFNGNGYTTYYNGSAWVYDSGDLNGLDDDGNGFADDLIGWDFMLNANGDQNYDPYESGAHGTVVSGIMAAVTNNTLGVSSLSWNLTLMPLSCSYPGSSSVFRGYNAIIYAAENGADIINCSWGGTGFSQANQDAINYAYSLGSIVIAAAGNSNNSIPLYPAGYQNVVATAALQNTGVKSSVSNYGGYVDVGAPNTTVWTTSGASYASVSGATSYASPIASALAGLIKSYMPAISQGDLIKRLKGSCDDVDALNAGKENLLGEGKLNARRALEEADPQPDSEVRLYLIENRGATDANSNNAVEPGESFSVNLLLRSYGDFPANGSFVLSTTNPNVIINSNTHLQAIPADGYLDLSSVFSITALPTAVSQYVNFTLTTTADLTVVAGGSITFSILIHNGGVFVWEGVASGRDMSGAYIRDTLQGLGYTVVYGTTYPASFFSFDAVFLSFGAVGSNIVRFDKSYMYAALKDYLLAGGRVYIEGVDVVGFDLSYYLPDVDGALDAHEVLWPLLGIAGANDGGTNAIDGLAGQSYTPASGLVFTASAQTKVDFIDTFIPLLPNARSALEESAYGCVSVANAGAYEQRSFVFSYALRELTDGDFPNTRANLLGRIMDFFEAEEVTLPVELTAFTATFGEHAMLSWSSASETGLLGYNLLRSLHPELPSAIRINSQLIQANGSSQGADYNYADTEIPEAESLFYWLEAVSYNGYEQHYGPLSLAVPNPGEPETPPPPESGILGLSAYPNPFGRELSIELQVKSSALIELQIFNLKGQIVKSFPQFSVESGTHFFHWDGRDTSGLPAGSGVYLIVVKTPTHNIRRKLVKL